MENFEIGLKKIKKLERKLNEGIMLLMVLKGELLLELNGIKVLLQENGLAVINEGDVYSAQGDGAGVTLFISFPQIFLLQNAPELLHRRFISTIDEGVTKKIEAFEELKHSTANITFLYLKKAEGYEMQMRSEIFRIFYFLRANFCIGFSENTLKAAGGQTEDNDRLSQVLLSIHQNYRFSYSLKDAAGGVYLTPQYLSRLFRQKMGMTFLDYLNRLRLEYAKRQLLYSELTIVRIAMESGFASEKAFGERFRKEYGITPAVYRTSHHMDEGKETTENQELTDISLETLMRFMENYDPPDVAKEARTVEIDVAKIQNGFRTHQNMIDVGPVSLVLRSDVRNQLLLAQEKLACKYVRFQLMNQTELLSAGNRIIPDYDYYSIIVFIKELELIPFIRLSVAEFLDGRYFKDFDEALQFLTELLGHLKNRCGMDYFESWCFELVGSSEELEQYFKRLSQALLAVSPEFSVGVQLNPDEGSREMRACLTAGKNACPLSFVTFKGDPNISRKRFNQTVFDPERQKRYYTDRIILVEQVTEELGLSGLPCYLVEWNTLTGSNVVEAGEFHRSALVADILSGLSGQVSGFSYWLNLLGPDQVIPELNTYPLSLFYYQDVPRALLFLATFLNNGSQQMLYRDSHVCCFRKSGGQLIVALYNPCHMEPFEALDNLRKSGLSCELRVMLKNMKNGRYAFKRYVLDKNNGSLYRNWINMDFTLTMYDDMAAAFKSGSSPSMSLYCREVEDMCLIEWELPMNGIAVYEINMTS